MIKILFFGRLSDLAKPMSCELPQAVKTAADLQLWLEKENAPLRPALSVKGNRISVNHIFVEKDALIKDGDEIAFMSPLSGG